MDVHDVPPYPAEPATAPVPRRRTRAEKRWVAAGLVAVWAVVLWLTWPGDSFGSWILGYLWYWLVTVLWVVLALATVAVTGWIWRSAVPVVAAAALIAGAAYWSQAPLSPRMHLRDPAAFFADHRGDFQDAVPYADQGEAYLGMPLPDDLAYLTTSGKVVGRNEGGVFFPQWFGIPDDAGGYWYSPQEPPDGFDMFGMLCADPVDLRDGWWMCGMKQ